MNNNSDGKWVKVLQTGHYMYEGVFNIHGQGRVSVQSDVFDVKLKNLFVAVPSGRLDSHMEGFYIF